MKQLNFTKMQGAGNDFVVIDNRQKIFTESEIITFAPKLCDRRFGIGADGIMALNRPKNDQLDYTMFYRNADGSDAGMCGNGARCLALFASQAGLGESLKFNVHDTVYRATVNSSAQTATIAFPMQVDVNEINLEEHQPAFQLYAGTEHLVIEATPEYFMDEELLRRRGRELRYDARFDPPGTNVNFIIGESSEAIRIKTYERGVENLTLACGTGAIASAIAWHHLQNAATNSTQIIVQTEGGTLAVNFEYNQGSDSYSNIKLSGEAHFVFTGTYAL